MAAAWSLSRFPDRYAVTVIEAGQVCGGVACSLERNFPMPDGTRLRAGINYGVQGGSPAAHQNTVALMSRFGLTPSPVELTVSFGKGENNWKNYERGELQRRLKRETARFGRVLKWIARLEPLCIFMSIDRLLRLFRFSDDFRYRMVFPLVALFFGTGNQTKDVSAAIVARVFLDESMAIFEYHAEYMLDATPSNIAFDNLEAFYESMRASMAKSGCRFLMRTKVTNVERGAQIKVAVEAAPASWRAGSEQPVQAFRVGPTPRVAQALGESPPDADGDAPSSSPPTGPLEFDELILAVPANAALRLLGDPSRAERRVLGSVEYFEDLSVTHTDEAYMRRHNEIDGRAIYFIKTLESQPSCCEMGFDLTGYQPELVPVRNGNADRVYQTIFLNKAARDQWTIDEIDPSRVIDKSWWTAFSHTYKHFRWVVPWVWSIQKPGRTLYAGSWTLFNTHDIAIASGLAAAHRLGAPYPFDDNPRARATFKTVLAASHLKLA
uniref:Amine oxidase domain-containing protein n=2 Tax=Calcidiscus leptoporus TaxID=127549 RepID=A0A7S0P1X8_9EUKA